MPIFRIMTYNILYGGVGREQLIRDVVTAIQPDVGIFTEVTRADSLDAVAADVGAYRAAAGRGSHEHPAIVSRWPLGGVDVHGPPWAPRKWVSATVRPFGGRPVAIHAVHLMPQPLWPFELGRHWEVASLLKRANTTPETPHIIGGDFNALSRGDSERGAGVPLWVRAQWWLQGGSTPRWAVGALLHAGYVDCYRACNPQRDGFTTPSWDPSIRIDYIFASQNLAAQLRSANVLESKRESPRGGPKRSLAQLVGRKPVQSLGGQASDHLAVWADFEWADGQ